MPISRSSVALGALAVLIVAGIPAVAQDRPESLLPPGFADPPPAQRTPPVRPQPARPGVPATPASPRLELPDLAPSPPPVDEPSATVESDTSDNDADEAPPAPDAATLARYELPDHARRSLFDVGVAGPGEGTLRPDAFGAADGVFVEQVMRRIRAPIASRWLSIALRRALVSRVATPPRVNGADFAAERAWLLLRMGEADAARALVQAVDSDRYTPKLYRVAMQAALATADPAALCAIADAGSRMLSEPAWTLARAMCAGLSGEPGIAGPMIDGARSRRIAGGIDVLLAEKVVGAGSRGRRAVTIQWDGVDRLNAWRFGLATATGVEIPDELYATVDRRVLFWRATSPMIPPRARAAAAELAAAQGVLSNLALVDLYALIDDGDDQGAEASVARDLRQAYVGGTAAERLGALRQLWDEPKTRGGRYARLVMTARAAARIGASGDHAADADRLVAAMLSAGLDVPALRWRSVVGRGSDAYAMLALADPRPADRISARDVNAYDTAKARMLFAGLAGLDRLSADDRASLAGSLEVPVDTANSWTRAIDDAARARQPGTVLVLAAVGMGTSDWTGVPPLALYHVVRALRMVGMEGEARMIAAEAIARL